MIRSVAITGATGFIGRHVAADLVARGVTVKAIVRPQSPHTAPPDTVVVAASLQSDLLRTAFAGVDAVVHLAGVVAAVDARTYAAVNTEGTRAVALAARDVGARLIHVSSLAAAGPAPTSAPHRETDPPHPVTPYGVSKLESERIVSALDDLRSIVLRPGVVYGPTDRAVFPLFQAAARGVLPLVGHPDAAYTFIYIDDIVQAITAAVDRSDASGTIFVGHPQPVTAHALADAISAANGRHVRLIRVPMAATYVAAIACDVASRILRRPMPLNMSRYAELEAEGFVCRVDRLRDELGVVAQTGLREGIAKTTAWYRDAGWIR
ncbi:MAG TPA: NAD-dependent epimerase/dehydratase family protein [Vicinamibacterales bacterium]|nr:NAD-dependent epimerase/dehydratase family protein [Vicinamibacterales bacterium]